MSGRKDGSVDVACLDEIARRVLWLSTRMIDAANGAVRDPGDVKVGGHQASSSSLVTAMIALWFDHLHPGDRVAVKPHAAPAFHAIQYLLGNLDRSYLTRLRAKGGLQAYPSRTKDPDAVDFSTGSVGLGVASTLFASAVRRYVDAHFGVRPRSRFIALVGDAELDEGNIWEAVLEVATQGLGTTMWIVDFNRQSLDRVVPGVRIRQWRGQFEAAGWHVVEVKYGTRLRAMFDRPGGDALRHWIDAMPNEHYQSLFGQRGARLRKQFCDGAPPEVAALVDTVPDDELYDLLTDLGGHSMEAMLSAYAECDSVADRPSVVFAYTVKGWGLPIAGNPRNHSALLTSEQIDQLRISVGLTTQTEWDAFDDASAAGMLCRRRQAALQRPSSRPGLQVDAPVATGIRTSKPISTQDAFGRVLVQLSRDSELAPFLVTASPDVATSTNLAGFINRAGVFAPEHRRRWDDDRLLSWDEGPSGQHLELGISEMNLFLLLGQLGLSWDFSDQPLIPIGTVYDPFICRGLDALIYAVYSGARFVITGTPSGVTLAHEGGAHQSTITPSIGLELPNLTAIEPTYAGALDWLLCDCLARIASIASDPGRDEGAYYLRLTTRQIDQAPFEAARRRLGETLLRRQVLAGAYRLVNADESAEGPAVYLVATGAVVPETVAAAAELSEEGVRAHVVDVTSADRLYQAWQRALRHGIRSAMSPAFPGSLSAVFRPRAPIVTVHDAASHAMSWIGSAIGVPCVPVGVDEFGQTGTINELYETHGLSSGAIVNAALTALALR